MSIIQLLLAGSTASPPPGGTQLPGGTWNPTPGFNAYTGYALTGADLIATIASTPPHHCGIRGTGAMTSGKYAFELTFSGATFSIAVAGISDGTSDWTTSAITGACGYSEVTGAGWINDTGTVTRNATQPPYIAFFAAGDVIGVYLDMDLGELYFYKNGVNQGIAFNSLLTTGPFYPAASIYAQTGTITLNASGPLVYTYP